MHINLFISGVEILTQKIADNLYQMVNISEYAGILLQMKIRVSFQNGYKKRSTSPKIRDDIDKQVIFTKECKSCGHRFKCHF